MKNFKLSNRQLGKIIGLGVGLVLIYFYDKSNGTEISCLALIKYAIVFLML